MIYTSSYKNCKNSSYQTYSISKDRGRDAGYDGPYFLLLAPKESFFRVWRNNQGVIDELDNNKYYMEEFYNQILKQLNPEDIYQTLDNSILLCYEDSNQFCHRHIVAAWLELSLGVKISEITVNKDQIEVKEKPDYIKKYLEELMMKKDKNKLLVKEPPLLEKKTIE